MVVRGLAWGTAAVVAVGGFLAAPAQAIPPDRGTVTFSFDSGPEVEPDLTAACGFEVTALTKGRISFTTFYDRVDGVPVERVTHANPSMVTIYEGPTGARVQTADRGLDTYTWISEDTLLYFGTGIHLKVKGEAYSIGLWRLTFAVGEDEDGNLTFDLMSAEYSGNFPSEYQYPGLVPYLCDALAG